MTDDTEATNREADSPTSHYAVRVARTALWFAWVIVQAAAVGALLLVRVLAKRERRARARRWILLEGNRWTLVVLLVGAVAILTFALSVLGAVGVSDGAFVATAFGAVISGMFSFVPIVVAVNQLTVSRLFDTPSQIRDQIRDVDAFRSKIESSHPDRSVSPTEPALFLAMAMEVVGDRVDALERAVDGTGDEVRTAVDEYVSVLRRQGEDLSDRLDGTHQPIIEFLPAMMGDGYSRNVNDARRLRERFGSHLPPDAESALEDLESTFVTLDVLRQYYKALYVNQELSRLSRLVGYTGLAAFLVSTFVIMAFANGQPLGGNPLLLDGLLSLAVAGVTLPFAILLSFLVRVATITKRTTAPRAFTPRRETPSNGSHRSESYSLGRADR